MNDLKTILVAVDFSAGSRTALDQAARIAGRNGAKLHVLHVIGSTAERLLTRLPCSVLVVKLPVQ